MSSAAERATPAAGAGPVVVYAINSFDRGGAELGLLATIDGGLFANCRLKIVALVRGNGGLESVLAERGYAPEILVDRGRMRAVDLPRLFARLRRVIGRTEPDVVIASLPQANLLARLCVAFRKRTTFISFEHNTHLSNEIYEAGYRLTSRRVDWTFADAPATLNAAIERLYRRTPRRRSVVPLVSFPSPAKRDFTIDSSRPLQIVNAGRFTNVKNQVALIEAAALLLGQGRDVALTLYGDGPERARYEALAARLGCASRVRFPGFVKDWWARAADVFVLTSLHEGLCIVVLEAMHAGIPVVAPLVGGLRDYAGHETVRVLSAPEPRVIADAIASTLDQTADTRSRVCAAGKMIDERFGAAAVRSAYGGVNRALIRSVRGYEVARCAANPEERLPHFERARRND